MLKSHEKFYSANGRRLVLVADDEFVNRELLGVVLANDYEVIYAEDGREALEQVRAHKDELSLLLLDLMMSGMSGMEVLHAMKADPELKHIPVIVLTADQSAEVDSLKNGAIDYIPKPYPQASIILARVVRAIELTEDREIIQSTERDALTGLYNREYFYRYAEQYDQHHKDAVMDAIVVDVHHFHMINERFGTAYGDEILKSIGERIREAVSESGGIVCRREADTFMVYCLTGLDYRAILDHASVDLTSDVSINSRVRLRMGVYAGVDRSLDMERRFDRAKMAADTVRGSFTKTIGMYDSTMHERELYAEQLIDDFHTAIDEGQFKVYFQPKFDVRPKSPALSSAEALVRWEHPTLGMVSPGSFIPLFEENGLIQELDNYVWRQTAAYLSDWKRRLGYCSSVSVNVSRIDMYDPDLIGKFQQILEDYDITADELLLEITESAYTQDSDQIIEAVNQLRQLGFRIEMDDFGTGYSSLNMISTLPIDALKLDMQFVRSAFKNEKDTSMLEVIIDIADHLAVPVIAEGVETEEQMLALKDLGCDIVQGYYFSRPVSADEYEPFLVTRKGLTEKDLRPEVIEVPAAAAPEEERPKRAVHLRLVNYLFVIIAFLLASALVVSDVFIDRSHVAMDQATENYGMAVQAAGDLGSGSDYLTVSVRSFVVKGELRYLNDYFEEAKVTKRRDLAVETLDRLLEGSDSKAGAALSNALATSNELMELEYEAMRLTQLAYGIPDADVPSEVSGYPISAQEAAMSVDEKRERAISLVFDDEYVVYKDQIRDYIAECSDELISDFDQRMVSTRVDMDHMMMVQATLLAALLCAVLAEVIFITSQIRIPLARMVEHMKAQEKVPPMGAEELRFVTQTYNEILEENQKANRKLSYEASHDALTGLMNRSAYELFMDNADQEHIALLVVDVDEFKGINDTYGHEVGDRVLKRVAEILTGSFRSVDCVARLGGDEFVVVMTRANSSMRQLVINKIARANALLARPGDGLPKVSLSVGVAFADREEPGGDLFKDADTALYEVKRGGRARCVVYGYDPDEELA